MGNTGNADLAVSNHTINRALRKTLAFEIILVVSFYLVLFVSAAGILNRQNQITSMTVSRFQMSADIQTLERLLLQHINLERGYRLLPDEETFNALIKNHEEFIALLQKTQSKLQRLPLEEASAKQEEISHAQKIFDLHEQIVTSLHLLLGRELINHPTHAGHGQAETTVDPAEQERQLSRFEQDAIAETITWRNLVDHDVSQLNTQLSRLQQTRNIVLAIQAFLVILSVILVAYSYILPSFKKILKQLIAQNEELRRADALKTEFIVIASHQLFTPLSIIRLFLASLTDEPFLQSKPDKLSLLEQAQVSARAMLDLIKDLLNLSRIEQGRFTIRTERVDIISLITEALKNLQQLAHQKKVKLTIAAAQPKVEMMIDPTLIKQALQNLIDNAIYYNHEGGSVAIHVTADASQCLIEVTDTGHGIKPEDVPNLFTKFSRGHGARELRPDGSGLGLYLAKTIVEHHGGRIWVKQSSHLGTTIAMLLPLVPPRPPALPENTNTMVSS